MRRIVKCQQCARRYDASTKEPGYRFRCRCGQALEVEVARPHTAEVVCCSACGGPREKMASRCRFCDADFTIHDRDIDTVCPNCFARVSDRARYCCQCAAQLSTEDTAGVETSFGCPVCGDDSRLASRRFGEENVNVLECPHCVGLWLGNDSFVQLRDRVQRHGVPASLGGPPPNPTGHDQKGPRYRKCIKCGHMMHRQNYGRGSGVIIDSCKNHGLWFDADELHRILQWINQGGQGRQDNSRTERTPASEQPILGEGPQAGESTIGGGMAFDYIFETQHERPDLLLALVKGLASLFNP